MTVFSTIAVVACTIKFTFRHLSLSLRERALKVEADRAKVQREGDERSKNCEKLRYVILNIFWSQDAIFTGFTLKKPVTRQRIQADLLYDTFCHTRFFLLLLTKWVPIALLLLLLFSP